MTNSKLNLRDSYAQFSGRTNYYSHESEECGGIMNFAAFLPAESKEKKVPFLFFLSGLTCTEENFITKSYAQIFAAKYGVAVIAPDTSPRGANVPGEDDSYDLGSGAGFYVDATEAPWSDRYRMDSYISNELYDLALTELPLDAKRSGIFGHSMGGHGALVLGLRNPQKFHSISAFAPICAPMQCPWGEKAFSNYLGKDQEKWKAYDANEIIAASGYDRHILIDQGLEDEFLAEQLHCDLFAQTCKDKNVELTLRKHASYDHSYFFISTFIEDHFKFHSQSY